MKIFWYNFLFLYLKYILYYIILQFIEHTSRAIHFLILYIYKMGKKDYCHFTKQETQHSLGRLVNFFFNKPRRNYNCSR